MFKLLGSICEPNEDPCALEAPSPVWKTDSNPHGMRRETVKGDNEVESRCGVDETGALPWERKMRLTLTEEK